MPSPLASSPSLAEAFDLLQAAGTFGLTLAVLLAGGMTFGLVLLFRRKEGALPTSAAGLEELSHRANSMLLHADDELAAAEHELGYAVAQFGESRTREFAEVLASARTSVGEAFRIKHRLDDAQLDSATERRQWNNQIIALAESARAKLATQSSSFAELRRSEADSPARLAALREGIAETRRRSENARAALEALDKRYKASAFDEVRGNADRADRLLDEADAKATDAEKRMSAAAVTAVSDDMNEAAALVHDARRLIDAVDDARAALDGADSALASLRDDAKKSLEEARALRDAAPDPDSGAQLIAAITRVETTLSNTAAARTKHDPVDEIDKVGQAMTALDGALAGARNQQQRLEHAQTALEGAMVTLHSQLAVTKSVMAQRKVGVTARSRLAEAERQLQVAEAETDPIAALDAARRATTAARDAEDLARYDAR